VANFFSTILDYLNPLSDNFFLKIAFVPSNNYINNQFNTLQQNINYRFSWVTDIQSMIKSIKMSDTTGGIANIHAVIPIINRDVVVVDFKYLNDHAEFIRGLVSALIYFLIIIYLIRNVPLLLGYMS
jgi:hypothetical protein